MLLPPKEFIGRVPWLHKVSELTFSQIKSICGNGQCLNMCGSVMMLFLRFCKQKKPSLSRLRCSLRCLASRKISKKNKKEAKNNINKKRRKLANRRLKRNGQKKNCLQAMKEEDITSTTLMFRSPSC